MFTGIISAVGSILSITKLSENFQMTISAPQLDFNSIKIGDSIAVNGVCLTVTTFASDHCSFCVDVSHETRDLTNLHLLHTGSKVHLEQAMTLGGRFDGHIVTGHVDATGQVIQIINHSGSTDYLIQAPATIQKYIARKGSIAVDGVSLTVNDIDNNGIFRLTIIPHTAAATCISSWQIGYQPNLEVDILSRYIERLHSFEVQNSKPASQGTLTEAMLAENGFF